MRSFYRISILVIYIAVQFNNSLGIIRTARDMKIEPSLNEAFHDSSIQSEGPITQDVCVVFEDSTNEVLNTVNPEAFSDFEDYHRTFKAEMKSLRKESQSEVMDFMNKTGRTYKSLWLTNEMFISDASLDLCENLGSFDNVILIRKEEKFQIHKPVHAGPIVERTNESINAVEWNIDKIQAPVAWGQNNVGQGCTVGIIDTGVRTTHECFSHDPTKFVAWFDAVNGKSAPYDDQGHGTHVCGTISGSKGIGVAPMANVIACKACDSGGGCREQALKTCCQFMSDMRPNLVSNSWGGPSSDTYKSVIQAWIALGIFPFFSAGNSGPSCQTLGSPGDYANVISVGSTTSQDSLSDFSSRGQSTSGLMGPTVCGPGSNINSAWKSSDTAYRAISGTSMACPHVSGLAALLLTQNGALTLSQLKQAITQGSIKSLVDPQQTCGGTAASSSPNNMFGSGRIDCVGALQAVTALTKENA